MSTESTTPHITQLRQHLFGALQDLRAIGRDDQQFPVRRSVGAGRQFHVRPSTNSPSIRMKVMRQLRSDRLAQP